MSGKIKVWKALLSLTLVFASGCTAIPQSWNPPTSTPFPTAAGTPSPLPPTPTATPWTAATPPYPAEGLVDRTVWDEIQQSEFVQGQYVLWQAWIYFWSHAQTPLITPETPLHFELLFDPWNLPRQANDNLPDKVAVMLRWTDTNGVEHISYFPRNTINPEESGKFQTVPPDIAGREGQYEIWDWAGVAPLDISNAIWRKGDFVRVNPDTGLAREAIGKDGKWMPVYGVEAVKPEAYTPEQLALVAASPTVLLEKMPLEKGFTTGPFADRMFYFGAGDEVKAVYDVETGEVHPAMMMNSGKMLVINERGMHEMKLSPELTYSWESAHKVIEYWRKKICDPDMPMVMSLEEVDMSPDGKSCNVYLHTMINMQEESVSAKRMVMNPDTPIILTINKDFSNSLRYGYNTITESYTGFGFHQNKDGTLRMITTREKSYVANPWLNLAIDIRQPLGIFLNLIESSAVQRWAQRDWLLDKYFGGGPDESYRDPSEPVPVIYGRELKVEK